MKKSLTLLLVMTLLISMMTGCGGTYQDSEKPAETPSTNDTETAADATGEATLSDDFTFAYQGVVTLNPILSQSGNDHNVFYLTQTQMLRFYGSDLQLDGAESYDVSDDKTVYTFNIRKDLTWSNGEAITAKDFEYYLYAMLTPSMGSPAGNGWFDIKNAEAYSTGKITDWSELGIKSLDENTLEITLEYPSDTFAQTVGTIHLYPLNQAFVEEMGDKLGSSVDTMLYSGPYIITDWVLDSSMELVKNDNYWDAANSFPTKNLHFIEINDDNTKVAMFENGEVDAIERVASQYYDSLSEYLDMRSGGGFMFLWVNENGMTDEAGKLLSNVNFRKALSYGFNRTGTVAAVNNANKATDRLIDSNFLAPNGQAFVDAYPIESAPLEGDTTAATAYLQKAMEELGYADVSELPEINIVTWDREEQKILLETIIDQWKQNLGLDNVVLTQYVIGTAIGAFYSLDYDIFCISWETDVLPTDIMRALMTDGEANFGIWSNAEFDALVNEAVQTLDEEKRAELSHQAEAIFIDDAGIIPLFEQGEASAIQSNVKGFKMSASSDGFQFNEMTVEK